MAAMKLSEAIRLGSLLKPQAFDEYSAAGSCALKAAQEAVGLSSADGGVTYHGLLDKFPVLGSDVTHPMHGMSVRLSTAIYTLNDAFKWTREAIADWVETIERRADGAVVGSHADPVLSETSGSAQSEAPKEFSSVTMVKA